MSNEFNHPFDEVVASAEVLIQNGANVYQKFTCENCGQRLAMDISNVFYIEGTCDQCGHITDIRKTGCNYIVVVDTRD